MGDIPCFVQERGCCSIDDIGFCFKRKFPIESQLKNDPNHHFFCDVFIILYPLSLFDGGLFVIYSIDSLATLCYFG